MFNKKQRTIILITLFLALLIVPTVMAVEGAATRVFNVIGGWIHEFLGWVGKLTKEAKLDEEDSAAVGFIRVSILAIVAIVGYTGLTFALPANAINRGARVSIAILIALIGAFIMPVEQVVSTGAFMASFVTWLVNFGLWALIGYIIFRAQFTGANPAGFRAFLNFGIQLFLLVTFAITMSVVYEQLGV